MPLVQRRKRPLARDKQEFRDDRLFIVACDDTYAPKQYFDFFRLPRVQIHVVSTEDGTSSAEAVLKRLLTYDFADGDERWLLLDTDHFTTGPHLEAFTRALREARQKDIRVALSKPCFELWLLLHFADKPSDAESETCGQVETALAKVLGTYNKCKLQNRYSLGSVGDACERARKLDSGGEIPSSPCTRVYRLWSSILKSALPSQLSSDQAALAKRVNALAAFG